MNCAHCAAVYDGLRNVVRLLGDESALVRGAAVWALSQLMARDKFETLGSKAVRAEPDEDVRAEWRRSS